MTNLAGLDTTQKNFTSHSVRKTLVQKLQKSGISKDKIASITSHRSEQSLRDYADIDSLRDYADTDIDDHAKMSKILSLSSHPSQPPQESSLPIKNLCHIYNLHAMYHFRFLIFTLHTLLVYPHPNNVFNGCNFYFGSSTSTSTQLHATNAKSVIVHSSNLMILTDLYLYYVYILCIIMITLHSKTMTVHLYD